MTLGAAVVAAGGAELAKGNGVAAGFGQAVAAVAEHVRPLAQPSFAAVAGVLELGELAGDAERSGVALDGVLGGGGVGVLGAELPAGMDHLLVVPGAGELVQLGRVADAAGGQAGGVEGLGGVLGDVVRDGLAVERAAGAGQRVGAVDGLVSHWSPKARVSAGAAGWSESGPVSSRTAAAALLMASHSKSGV